uniref:DUF148 domain-containing protein n=1 Tax=Rhabditophanes sp. KR3021 TaxID=114890 RepID=A0AC35UDP1_9BILA
MKIFLFFMFLAVQGLLAKPVLNNDAAVPDNDKLETSQFVEQNADEVRNMIKKFFVELDTSNDKQFKNHFFRMLAELSATALAHMEGRKKGELSTTINNTKTGKSSNLNVVINARPTAEELKPFYAGMPNGFVPFGSNYWWK